MSLALTLVQFVPQPSRTVRRLARESVLGSRRNAMIASTALAQRRAERDEVEDFLAALGAPHEAPASTSAGVAGHR